MIYFISRNILKLFFKIFFRLKIVGSANCPKTGPLIIAPNHTSFLDPLIAGFAVPRPLNFMARRSLFKNKFFGNIIKSVNAFPLKREGADVGAMRLAIDKLCQGKAVLIFPEGTRSKDGNLGEPRAGIGFLAASSGANILPCYIKGPREALPKGAIFPRFKKITVYVGKPLKMDKNKSEKEYYMQIAEDTMAAIKDLKNKA
ncbi:MAG: 1-acyl-sn-glycerol-3-phosphate acyltransferase [Candidatus Omnitrophica bacterium CG22_combo_CG10-13_8_21_14_all_43_16]|nr:MAG: 1-acyl-sn-glycerol-3-phosphate acyltransferase [Candidatus Omnitrophica bacterium CG22_combo_CG10-13_8_21_14_all_43_16]